MLNNYIFIMSLKIKSHIIGYVLAVLMIFALVNSAYFFLHVVKLKIGDWLVFNACSVAIIVYLICFTCFLITRKEYFLAIAIVPLYYYGTMGLFVIPWNGPNAFAQVTHIIITLNVIWILNQILKEPGIKSSGIGLLVGIIVFIPVFVLVQYYSKLHLTEIMQLIQGVG